MFKELDDALIKLAKSDGCIEDFDWIRDEFENVIDELNKIKKSFGYDTKMGFYYFHSSENSNKNKI